MSNQIPVKAIPGYFNSTPGIQVGTKFCKITVDEKGNNQFDEEYLALLRQLGVEWVMVGGGPVYSADAYTVVRQQIEEKGFKIYRLPQTGVHNIPEVTLNLPGRDEKIEQFLTHIENLGKAGIYYHTYAHMGNGIWRSNQVETVRGGGVGTGLRLDGPRHTTYGTGTFKEPLSHGREYSDDEIWENYE